MKNIFLIKLIKVKQVDVLTQTHIEGPLNKFPDFFCTGIQNCLRLLKIQHVIAIHLMR